MEKKIKEYYRTGYDDFYDTAPTVLLIFGAIALVLIGIGILIGERTEILGRYSKTKKS